MNNQSSPDMPESLRQYGSTERPEFEHSAPPAQPKRLQRISRNSQSASLNYHSQQQQQQHQYYQQPMHQSFQNMQQYPSHQYPGGYPMPRPSQSQVSVAPQQRSSTLTRNSTSRDSHQAPAHFLQHQQHQQQQHSRPPHAYELPHSPSSYSDNGVSSSQSAAAPQYHRAHSSSSMVRPSNQYLYVQAPAGAIPMRPMPGPPANYPSAMLVGGGMTAGSRIVPSQELINSVASAGVDRGQRERDLANALGRRRPTYGS
ncbi:hypothetical protein LPJ56_007346, partial [Coemansia sp. RSA 2599]